MVKKKKQQQNMTLLIIIVAAFLLLKPPSIGTQAAGDEYCSDPDAMIGDCTCIGGYPLTCVNGVWEYDAYICGENQGETGDCRFGDNVISSDFCGQEMCEVEAPDYCSDPNAIIGDCTCAGGQPMECVNGVWEDDTYTCGQSGDETGNCIYGDNVISSDCGQMLCETEPSDCSDSDGGLDYLTKGTVTRTSSTYTDFCVQASGNLVEYYCMGNSLAQEQLSCESYYGYGYSCSDGSCIASCDPPCPNKEDYPCGEYLDPYPGCYGPCEAGTKCLSGECVNGACTTCTDYTYRCTEGEIDYKACDNDIVTLGNCQSGYICSVPFAVGDSLLTLEEARGLVCTPEDCIPDCSCAADTLIGERCDDGCNGLCPGTKCTDYTYRCTEGEIDYKACDNDIVTLGNCQSGYVCEVSFAVGDSSLTLEEARGLVCTPDCSCAADTCIGQTCSEDCPGSKVCMFCSDVGTCRPSCTLYGEESKPGNFEDCNFAEYCCVSEDCVDTTWTPARSTECSGKNFTQQSNCANSRIVTGTKDCVDDDECMPLLSKWNKETGECDINIGAIILIIGAIFALKMSRK